MRNLYESLLNDKDQKMRNVKQHVDKKSIRVAFNEFLEGLYIEYDDYKSGNKAPVIVNRGHEWLDHKLVTVKYFMKNVLDHCISEYGREWYLNQNYEEMLETCRNLILDSLKNNFEKTLDNKHIKWQRQKQNDARGNPYVIYTFKGNSDDLEKEHIWFNISRKSFGDDKQYNKKNKNTNIYRLDFKNFSWCFEALVPEDIWLA